MADDTDNAAHYCMNLLRERDIDRYLASLFIPQPARRAIVALYAFDAEIGHIRNVIKDPMMGEIRMQWWRDVISGGRSVEAASNPVAAELLTAIEQHQLQTQTFENLLEARLFDLYDDPMPDTHTLEGYAGETASALFNQAAMIVEADSKGTLADCAGHAGVVWTIITILKALPLHRSRQQCYVPADILQQAGLSSEEFWAGEKEPETGNMISALVALALNHLGSFKKAIHPQPDAVRAVFLPITLATPYLRRFEKAGYNATQRPVDIVQWRKQLYLWRAARSGVF